MALLEDSKNQVSGQELRDEEALFASIDNPELFTKIVDRYQEAFLRKAKTILSEDDAYDAVQETFVRIYASAKKFTVQEGASFKSWGYKILINQCFTAYAKRKKDSSRRFDIDQELMEAFPDKAEIESFDQKLTKEYVLQMISKLPIVLGRVVRLYFLEEIPQKEIAEMEGVTNEVVRTRIHRAKKELKKISLEVL
jgi:RNA polymerase sigma factor (sigma-70 family)